jgi:hypothetical protein
VFFVKERDQQVTGGLVVLHRSSQLKEVIKSECSNGRYVGDQSKASYVTGAIR